MEYLLSIQIILIVVWGFIYGWILDVYHDKTDQKHWKTFLLFKVLLVGVRNLTILLLLLGMYTHIMGGSICAPFMVFACPALVFAASLIFSLYARQFFWIERPERRSFKEWYEDMWDAAEKPTAVRST